MADLEWACIPPTCNISSYTWSSETSSCMRLAHTMPVKGYGKLTRVRNELELAAPWFEPLRIFFRFAGISRHDPPGESTPTLGVMGLHRTLSMLRSEQAAATTVTVMLNGAGDTVLHREWFDARLAPRLSRVELVRAPSGLRQSFKFQQARLRALRPYTTLASTHCRRAQATCALCFSGAHPQKCQRATRHRLRPGGGLPSRRQHASAATILLSRIQPLYGRAVR